jgi:hypothetical protein
VRTNCVDGLHAMPSSNGRIAMLFHFQITCQRLTSFHFPSQRLLKCTLDHGDGPAARRSHTKIEGAPRKYHRAKAMSQMAQSADDRETKGTIGFP